VGKVSPAHLPLSKQNCALDFQDQFGYVRCVRELEALK